MRSALSCGIATAVGRVRLIEVGTGIRLRRDQPKTARLARCGLWWTSHGRLPLLRLRLLNRRYELLQTSVICSVSLPGIVSERHLSRRDRMQIVVCLSCLCVFQSAWFIQGTSFRCHRCRRQRTIGSCEQRQLLSFQGSAQGECRQFVRLLDDLQSSFRGRLILSRFVRSRQDDVHHV